jgi:hypothetical protein
MIHLPAIKRISAFAMLVFLFSSCTDKKDNNIEAFKALNESLVNSTENMCYQNMYLYHNLLNKTYDPFTREKAVFYQPRVNAINDISTNIITYIDVVKNDFREELKKNGIDSLAQNNTQIAKSFFSDNGKGKGLHIELQKYIQAVFSLDSILNFQTSYSKSLRSLDSAISNRQNFSEIYFNDISPIAALTLLNKWQNDCRIIENNILVFCTDQIPSNYCGFTRYLPLATINSSCVKANEKVIVTVGIGAFNDAVKPVIHISGKNIPLNDDGVAVYEIKAPKESGEYKVPVQIEYTRMDGEKSHLLKDIKYTVVKP